MSGTSPTGREGQYWRWNVAGRYGPRTTAVIGFLVAKREPPFPTFHSCASTIQLHLLRLPRDSRPFSAYESEIVCYLELVGRFLLGEWGQCRYVLVLEFEVWRDGRERGAAAGRREMRIGG
jgi:hypothetical protein